MLMNLCASWAHTAVDILALVMIVGFAFVAAKKGFVECFFGFISTIAAIIIALLLMKPLLGWTGGLFGLQGVLEKGCVDAFSKIEAFRTDVSNEGLSAMLEAQNLPTFLVKLVVDAVGNTEIPSGTTLATVVGTPLGTLATTLVSWLLIFLLAKLLFSLVKRLFSAIVRNIPLVGAVNGLLGFFVGALQGLLIVSGVVAVLALIPVEGLTTFFNQTGFVGWLYNNNPINTILGWFIV